LDVLAEDREALPFTPLHKTVLEGEQPCLLELLQLQDKSKEQTVDVLLTILQIKQKQLHPSLMASTLLILLTVIN